ncbi:MAG TPA: hypothetical protein VNC80_03700, partial [Mycobacteriales bacterium]|nr:hypothetical protein [Mycobacteriales bacterium]
KVNVVATFGAVKLAIAVLALDRVTAGVPDSWDQANPVAFSEADPSSCTCWLNGSSNPINLPSRKTARTPADMRLIGAARDPAKARGRASARRV